MRPNVRVDGLYPPPLCACRQGAELGRRSASAEDLSSELQTRWRVDGLRIWNTGDLILWLFILIVLAGGDGRAI